MCNNPTTDGDLNWADHEIVAYVDVTAPVKTQAEHMARLNEIKEDLEEEIGSHEPLPEDDEDYEDDEEHIDGRRQELEDVNGLLSVPLAVEDLAKIYYVGIGSVPSDLVVDVVLSAGCPLDPRSPTKFQKGSVQDDLRTAVARHLRPGGELYIVGGGWKDFHKTYHEGFAPLVDYVRNETAAISSDYMEARGTGGEQEYSVLVRKAAGGRRRKTLKRRKLSKKTRRA